MKIQELTLEQQADLDSVWTKLTPEQNDALDRNWIGRIVKEVYESIEDSVYVILDEQLKSDAQDILLRDLIIRLIKDITYYNQNTVMDLKEYFKEVEHVLMIKK